MKGTYNFRPGLDWGAGTQSVLRVLGEWADVDWFERPSVGSEEALSVTMEHHAIATALRPDLLSVPPRLNVVSGGWRDFRGLAQKVRCADGRTGSSWDWKYGVLKKLSRGHWDAHGWSPEDIAFELSAAKGGVPDGELFFRLPNQGAVIWNAPDPKLDLASVLPKEDADAGRWYLNYARADVIDCAAWQLAAGEDSLEGNPFYSLICCYGAGYWPFALSREEWVLFAFDGKHGVDAGRPVAF